MEPFFIVIQADQSPMQATRRHATKSDATAEAERLCQRTGKAFIVLEAIGWVKVAQLPVEWHGFGDDEA